jgi:hypothetical protein
MVEIMMKDIKRIAQAQFKDEGRVSPAILDLIIADWQIDLDLFKNKEMARELWRKLIMLYLIAPTEYRKFCNDLKNTVKRLESGHEIPDIVA